MPALKRRELRVFLSSTFKDMQLERDYLVKHVFPDLRQACRARQVEFTEIDLRWGVTQEEAEQGKVVRICLDEIERCRPYFLSLLGERYGWAPIDSDLGQKQDLVKQFPSIEPSLRGKKSLTEIEIRHGVLDNPAMAEHSFFYFRAAHLTKSMATKARRRDDYFEGVPSERQKLDDLKLAIRASRLPLYENYPSVESLGARVKNDLLAALDKRFPENDIPTPAQVERNTHLAYAEDRCKAYIPNPVDIAKLDAWLATDTPANVQSRAMILTGESGLGKSSLLAYWLSRVKTRQPQRFIIEHYAGVSGDASPSSILHRLISEIRDRLSDTEEISTTPDGIVEAFPLWLAKVRADDPLLLVLDGTNQIEGNSLSWLPTFWPANVQFVASTLPDESLDELRLRSWDVYYVAPMDTRRRALFIRSFLATYRKTLSAQQSSRLSAAGQCGNPLFLRLVLEELRVFGSFEQLDRQIDRLLQATDPKELFITILSRMEKDYGKLAVSGALSAICAARKGLTEGEILDVTGLSRLDASALLLAFDYHLSRRAGLLNFFHDYLRAAVSLRYLSRDKARLGAHRKLARYFDTKTLDHRKITELPWQWQQVSAFRNLKLCISDIPTFDLLYRTSKYELLGYWLTLRDRYDVGKTYLAAVRRWEVVANARSSNLPSEFARVGRFLADECGRYPEAIRIAEKSVALAEAAAGGNRMDLLESLSNLGSVLQLAGQFKDARSMFERSLTLREQLYGPNHLATAASLTDIAKLYGALGVHALNAEILYRRALAIQTTALGSRNASVAGTLNSLANLLKGSGRDQEALDLYQQSLELREISSGKGHPETAAVHNAMGDYFEDQNNLVSAANHYQQALEIRTRTLGPEHPATAASLNNLARTAQKNGDLALAETLSIRALSLREKLLQQNHPDIATSLNNMARLRQAQGRLCEAEEYFSKALAICLRAFGEIHRRTLRNVEQLASLYRQQGRAADAEALETRAKKIRAKAAESKTDVVPVAVQPLSGRDL